MGYLKHKPGSIEELVAKQGSYREDSGCLLYTSDAADES